MRKISIITVLFLFSLGQLLSQDLADNSDYHTKDKAEKKHFELRGIITYEQIQKDLEALNNSIVRDHMLGKEVARRLHLLEKSYTYYSKPPGAFSSRKIIEKPVIYNSIFKIEKYLRKQVKRDIRLKNDAAMELCHYLDLSLMMYYENTDKFEKELKKSDSVKHLIALYNKISIQ